MAKRTVTGGTGITAGGDVTFGDNTGQIAIGENITQTQTLSSSDKKELKDSLVQFQKEIAKLSLSADTMATVNGDVTAAIKEADKEKPDPSRLRAGLKEHLIRSRRLAILSRKYLNGNGLEK